MTMTNDLDPNGVFFGVRVGGVRGDDVANPPKRAARPKPEPWRKNKPQNSSQNTTVVELANARNNKT